MTNFYAFKKHYALMPLIENIGGIDYTYAYVATECEFLGETKVEENGKEITAYNVVFKWNENEENIKPIYDENNNNNCINSVVVKELFVDAKEAKQKSQELNEKIIKDKIKASPLDKVRALSEDLKIRLMYAQALEKKHFTNNNDYQK